MGEGRYVAKGKELFHVAQKLDVIEENFETGRRNTYFSRIEDVREHSLLILPPFHKGFSLVPRIGRVITAKVVSERVPYLFDASLLSFISDQIPLWEISRPEQVTKVQLRENVRLGIVLNVSLELLDPERGGKVIKTLTRDISAGGIQVVLPESLPVGTKLRVYLPLPDCLVIDVEGIISRLIPPATDAERLSAGIRFAKLDERIENQVIRFIFAKEAEIRQKEKVWNE
mgnify:CR=1 FL=1